MNSKTIDDFFPSEWLKADDIPDNKFLVLTIKSLEWEEIGFDKEVKPVMTFNEINKKIVINKTNGKTLESLYGKLIENFINKKIILQKQPVEYKGTTTLGVRIRPEIPQNINRIEPDRDDQINMALGEAEVPE